jgi:TolB protein
VNLTRSSGNEYGGAAWSPDGLRIAFVRIDGFVGPGQLHVMNAEGSRPLNLRASTVPDFSPSWSPDGTRLAFTAHPGPFRIQVMRADGKGLRPLVAASGAFPRWSPNDR